MLVLIGIGKVTDQPPPMMVLEHGKGYNEFGIFAATPSLERIAGLCTILAKLR